MGYFCDNETVNLVDRIKEMIKYKGNQVNWQISGGIRWLSLLLFVAEYGCILFSH